ncbi:MAG TPA: polyhydroxyalkanoic acid system family protein [Polyangiales bacterium]|nr:polyhydroxyalkanoic acid system family protein [Polyangiales bacterium]
MPSSVAPGGLMEHIIKHDLSPELAKKAAEKAAEHYTQKWQKYNAKTTWVTDSKAEITFHVKGVHVAATVDMQPGQAVIEMDKVPLLLRPFKNMALDVVQKTMQKWIDKAKSGELA